MANITRYLVSFLLSLYPQSWRDRYGEEVAAILEECPPSLQTVFNLLLGMIDAHLHADLFTARAVTLKQRIRSGYIAVYSSAIVFISLFIFYFSYCPNYVSKCFYFNPNNDISYYITANGFTWYSSITNNPLLIGFSWFLENFFILLVALTLIGSLFFVATLLRQYLTNKLHFSFFIWSFVFIGCIAAFYSITRVSSIVMYVFIPTNPAHTHRISYLLPTNPPVSANSTFLTMLNPYFSSLFEILTLFGTQLCISLTFVFVYKIFTTWKEKHNWSVIPWVLCFCATLCLFQIINFGVEYYDLLPYRAAIIVQNANIILSVIVVGWCFIYELRRKRSAKLRAYLQSYKSLLLPASIAFMMSGLALAIVLLSYFNFDNTNSSNFVTNSLVFFIVALALYTFISVWNVFHDQQELLSLDETSQECENAMYMEQHIRDQMRISPSIAVFFLDM